MSEATGKVALVEKKFLKPQSREFPVFGPGDTLRVHAKIKEGDKERIQVFEGIVIALNNSSSKRTFTIRKASHGVGVERVFPLFSPNIAKIERAEVGKVRRSKLYYLRGLAGKAAKVRNENEMQ